MTSKFDSKHGIVSRPPFDLYMAFTDMRNFQQMLPEDKREGVTADFDTLQANIQGYSIGVKVYERRLIPRSRWSTTVLLSHSR